MGAVGGRWWRTPPGPGPLGSEPAPVHGNRICEHLGAVRLRGRDVSGRRLAHGGRGRVRTAPGPTGSAPGPLSSGAPLTAARPARAVLATLRRSGVARPSLPGCGVWALPIFPSPRSLVVATHWSSGSGCCSRGRAVSLEQACSWCSGSAPSPSPCLGLAAARGCCAAPDSPPGDGAA